MANFLKGISQTPVQAEPSILDRFFQGFQIGADTAIRGQQVGLQERQLGLQRLTTQSALESNAALNALRHQQIAANRELLPLQKASLMYQSDMDRHKRDMAVLEEQHQLDANRLQNEVLHFMAEGLPADQTEAGIYDIASKYPDNPLVSQTITPYLARVEESRKMENRKLELDANLRLRSIQETTAKTQLAVAEGELEAIRAGGGVRPTAEQRTTEYFLKLLEERRALMKTGDPIDLARAQDINRVVDDPRTRTVLSNALSILGQSLEAKLDAPAVFSQLAQALDALDAGATMSDVIRQLGGDAAPAAPPRVLKSTTKDGRALTIERLE